MIKKALSTIFIFALLTSPSYSQIRSSTAPGIYIQEEDGDPASRFRTIKVTNGALTDNADGSASIATGGGSGATELSGLSDIGTSTATAGNLLFSDGSQFNAHGDAPTDEYCLTYEATGATLAWQTCGAGGGATELDGLSDVNSSTDTAGHILVADGSGFDSVAVSSEATMDSAGAVTLADSVTVTGWAMGASTATTPAADDSDTSLATTAYVQGELQLSGLSDVATSTATAGHILQASGGSYNNIDMQVAMGAETSTACITVMEPDKVQAVKDNIPLIPVETTRFPNGIEISQVYLKTDASSTYSINLEKWSSPVDAGADTLTTLATSTSTEANEAPDTEGSVGTSEIIMVDLSTDDINWIEVCIDFVEPSL